MATNVPNYSRFFGTNYSCYEIYFYPSNSSYYLTSARVAGTAATVPASGEIVIKLDWRQLADGNSYNTYQVAAAITPALLSANFMPELGGHAIAEFPLHLIGHSRGGSLICELSRQLGTNGVWVDHVTTLDPHPLNDPAFPLDAFLYDAVDAPANTYQTVLYADNYWQDISSVIRGKAVSGAYTRKLTSLSGGYGSSGAGPHSNVHLWYHGTLDARTPTSDTEADIMSTQRTNWWVAMETNGISTGFLYSLIGGANRASTNRPLGAGFGAIQDGLNQTWDFGAGVSANRTALTTNNGNWPNLIKFNRASTNKVAPGQSTILTYAYQWARPATSNAVVSIYLDDDLNPLNTNQTLLRQINVPANGAGFVSFSATNLFIAASNATPGVHWFLASISGGGRTRYLYAPESVEFINLQPPVLDIVMLGAGQFQIGVNGQTGQTVIIQRSADLNAWLPLATNTPASNRWTYTDSSTGNASQRFYRAVLAP
jgi:hypothetical protein